MNIISVKNLSKSFSYYNKEEGLMGSFKALFYRKKLIKDAVKDVSFEIKKGEFVGFIGPNGAGKTTTLKMLSGILTPSAGKISVMGHNPSLRENEYKKKISIVMGQKSQIWHMLPTIDSFRLIQKIYEIPEKAYQRRLKDLSQMLKISDLLNIQARKLSLGQRMKCEITASLLHNPSVLYLDEPTIGLDIFSQKIIQKFLKEYNRDSKTTIILTSHYMEDIKVLCERIILINEGRLLLDSNLSEVIKKYSIDKNIKATFREKVKKLDLSKIGKISSFTGYEAELSFPSEKSKEKLTQLLQNFPVLDINIQDVTLEEIISDIYRQ